MFRAPAKLTVTLLVVVASSVCQGATDQNSAPEPPEGPPPPPPIPGITYYLSPSGSDAADGLSEAAAWKTFAHAFSTMAPGNELVLLDGTYSEAAGTGYIDHRGTNSGQPPSGPSSGQPTRVRAKTPGLVTVLGRLFLGRSFRKDSNIVVQGITFEGGGRLYNTHRIYIKDCGFHADDGSSGSIFGIGTNDHDNGNSYNLIEDVWIWGKRRIMAITYRSDHNVWRRVVIRGDGCESDGCAGSGNPNAGISTYESTYTSLQNVIVLDRILSLGAGGGADFAVAQHTSGRPHGENEWLGVITIGAPKNGFNLEPDQVTLTPAHRVENCVVLDAGRTGLNAQGSGQNVIRNCTVKQSSSRDGLRLAPELPTGVVENIIVFGGGRYGVNSSTTPTYVDVFGTWTEGTYGQNECSSGCRTTDPENDGSPPSLLYPLRIEEGSVLKGTGAGGADYGANVVYHYGEDGAFWGDTDFNTLSDWLLWPWPNQERIETAFCASANHGWCGTGLTLTEYVWTQFGNPLPPGISP